MLKATIEVLPYGKEPAQLVGTLVVANDGTGDAEYGNYQVELVSPDLQGSGEVKLWRRSKGAIPLVAEALQVVLREMEPRT